MFSFTKKRKSVEINGYLRRLCDLTTPNHGPPKETERAENRYNRTIPALICPWASGQAAAEQASFAVTKDISDRGVAVVVRDRMVADHLVIGFWTSREQSLEPWFFISEVRCEVPLGAGFWNVGLSLTEFANMNYARELASLHSLASTLLPPRASE